jgi:hypothetical protein
MLSGDIEQAPRHGVQVTEPLATRTYSQKALPVINVPQRLGAHPSVDEWAVNSPNPEITRKEIRLIRTVQPIRRIAKISIPNPQKFLPLPNVPLEAQALGNPEGRDQTSLDLLAAFSGVIAI